MMDLFGGSRSSHGRYIVGQRKEGSLKVDGQAITVKNSGPTLEIWEAHIAGDTGLGVVLVDEDATVRAACVDIDIYDGLDIGRVLKVAKYLGAICFYSKSNGIHFYLFFPAPTPAKRTRELMRRIAGLLELPDGVEVFPKQDTLENNAIGNWINMPYFGESRPALDYECVPIDLEAFLARVAACTATLEHYEQLVVKAEKKVTRRNAAQVVADLWVPGQRDDLATALTGVLLRDNWDEARIDDLLSEAAGIAGDEEWRSRSKASRLAARLDNGGRVPGIPKLEELIGKKDTKRLLKALGIRRSNVRTALQTDLGNTVCLRQRKGDDLFYVHAAKKWYEWKGGRWVTDEHGQVLRRCEEAISEALMESAEDPALRNWYTRCLNLGPLERMERMGRSYLAVPFTELDHDPWLLGTPSGTVDLQRGALREPDRDDFITRSVRCTYNAEAQCPKWLQFLDEIMLGRQDLVDHLQRYAGYAISGMSNEQVMLIAYGKGANGKSTFVNVLHHLFGDYAINASTDLLLPRQVGAASNDLARLQNVRFVSALETEENARLSESVVKQLTGSDTITARFLYGEYFDFAPTHTIIFGTNHKPQIKGDDHAIWRRIQLVPFDYTVPPEKMNKDLETELLDELPGILNWVIEGCIMWQTGGLQPPAEVLEATESYRQEEDVLGDWLHQFCILDPQAYVKSGALYSSYKGYMYDSGGTERAMSQIAFSRKILEREGITKREKTYEDGVQGTYYYGVGLLDQGHEM
jgi:putative DNA primase/helicase